MHLPRGVSENEMIIFQLSIFRCNQVGGFNTHLKNISQIANLPQIGWK